MQFKWDETQNYNAKDNKYLIENAMKGGRKERDQLIENNIPLVVRIANSFNTSYDREELFQEGMIALTEVIDRALNTQNLTYETFGSYIYKTVMFSMSKIMKSRNMLDTCSYSGYNREAKQMQSNDDIENETISNIFMGNLINNLDEQSSELIRLRFIKGLTQWEVSKQLGLSRQVISYREKVLMQRIKRAYKFN